MEGNSRLLATASYMLVTFYLEVGLLEGPEEGEALGALDGFCEGESLGLALGRALLEGAAEGWYF